MDAVLCSDGGQFGGSSCEDILETSLQNQNEKKPKKSHMVFDTVLSLPGTFTVDTLEKS